MREGWPELGFCGRWCVCNYSKSKVFAENKLFATLDTTVRKVVLGNLPLLLTDTVGFIRKLPQQLMESFKSTLDEVREADLLIHVLDISHSNFEDHYRVVNETLSEIDKSSKPTIVVFNKIGVVVFVFVCFFFLVVVVWVGGVGGGGGGW